MEYIQLGVIRGQSEAELGPWMVGTMGRDTGESGKENDDAHKKGHRTASMVSAANGLTFSNALNLPTCF